MTLPIEDGPALYDPETGRIYTFLTESDSGELVCMFGGKTPAQAIAAGHVSASAVVLPQDEALALVEAETRRRLCRGPEEISEERFDEMLNCLPPERWHVGSNCESFRISEMVSGSIACFCVKIGSRYFTLNEDYRTAHTELIAACAATLQD